MYITNFMIVYGGIVYKSHILNTLNCKNSNCPLIWSTFYYETLVLSFFSQIIGWLEFLSDKVLTNLISTRSFIYCYYLQVDSVEMCIPRKDPARSIRWHCSHPRQCHVTTTTQILHRGGRGAQVIDNSFPCLTLVLFLNWVTRRKSLSPESRRNTVGSLFTPCMRLFKILSAPCLHPVCILSASCHHPVFILSAPCLHLVSMVTLSPLTGPHSARSLRRMTRVTSLLPC